MARKRQKNGKRVVREGKRVAARVAERERMNALWKEAQALADEGKDAQALRALGRYAPG